MTIREMKLIMICDSIVGLGAVIGVSTLCMFKKLRTYKNAMDAEIEAIRHAMTQVMDKYELTELKSDAHK